MGENVTAPIQRPEMTRTNQDVLSKPETKREALISGRASGTLLHREAVLARMDGDETLLQEIISMFLEYAPHRRDEIRRAIKNGDFASLRRTTHALKASVGYLEAGSVLNAIYQLDQLAVSADARRLPEALAEFERHFEEFTIAAAALVSGDGY